MKRKKLFFIKRILALFCCTILLTSSIFASYSMTVYAAEDNYDLKDALQDICLVVLGIGAVLCPPAELTVLGFFSILSGVLGAVDGAINIYDHVTDNGDGTYTIDPAFIQAAMDAAEQLEAQGFTDKDIINQKNGRYSIHYSTFYNKYWCSKHKDTIESCKFEGLISVISGRSAMYVSGPNESLGTYSLSIGYEYGAQYLVEYQRQTFSCGYTRNNDSLGGNTYGANIPIFTDNSAYKNYLSTGAGYKNAENYRPAPLFRRHSSYTPTYSGGPVTVNRTVIQNITQKISEVDADDSLTDDQKIELLQQYILSGNIPDTGDDGGGDKDYDDNKDLPAGTDLTDTNSWLKKIYLKVCQIFDKMSTSAGQTMDDVVTAIEDLSKMLKRYLSEITGDLDDIKGQLENMSEQEFEQKTGDFLDDTMAEFSDIGEKAKTKFPFSIPNDIKLLISKMSVPPPGDAGGGESGVYSVNMMSADDPGDGLITVAEGDPEDAPAISDTGAPIFYLPFVIESAGINEFVVIDLSGFESVSKFCRGLLTIWFILCLYNMTFKVLGLWGDLVD